MEIPCPTCRTREILMTDKWNIPAELPTDKRTSGDEFTCVLALLSAPKFLEKELPFKEGNAKGVLASVPTHGFALNFA